MPPNDATVDRTTITTAYRTHSSELLRTTSRVLGHSAQYSQPALAWVTKVTWSRGCVEPTNIRAGVVRVVRRSGRTRGADRTMPTDGNGQSMDLFAQGGELSGCGTAHKQPSSTGQSQIGHEHGCACAMPRTHRRNAQVSFLSRRKPGQLNPWRRFQTWPADMSP